MTDDNAHRALLHEWLERVKVNVDAHNDAERRFHWLDNVTGAIALAAIVVLGTTAVSFDLRSGWPVVVVVVITGLGALASAFQTQLRLGSTAVAHQAAARQYSALRRSIESALAAEPSTLAGRAEAIGREWDVAAVGAPNVPSAIRRRARGRRTAARAAATRATSPPG